MIERDLDAVCDAQLAATQRALSAVRDLDDQTGAETTEILDRLADRTATVRAALTELDAMLDRA